MLPTGAKHHQTSKPSNKLSSPPLGDRRIIYTPPTPKSNQTTMTPNTHPTNPHNTTKNHPTTPTHHNKKADPTTPQQRNQARQTPQKKLSSHPYHLFIAHFGACNLTVEASSTDRRTENMTRP